MADYKYERPTNAGYIKFKLTRGDHNDILPKRKVNCFTKIEAYYRVDGILIEYTTNLLGKVVLTALLPVYVIMHGVCSIKDIWVEYKRNLKPYKTGEIYDEYIPQSSDAFKELEKIYKNNMRNEDEITHQ